MNIVNSVSFVQVEFDNIAHEYEVNRLSDWYKAHSHEIFKNCPKQIRGDILDIGCGTGYLLRLLAQKYPNSNTIGLDISPKMIKQAKLYSDQLKLHNTNFLCADWENIDHIDFTWLEQFNFELIICANTFHYFLDPQKTIINKNKLLSPGGIILVLERDKSKSFLTSLWGSIHKNLIKDQVKFYRTNEITEMFQKKGFSKITIIEKIRKYFWKNKIFTSVALIQVEKSNSKVN